MDGKCCEKTWLKSDVSLLSNRLVWSRFISTLSGTRRLCSWVSYFTESSIFSHQCSLTEALILKQFVLSQGLHNASLSLWIKFLHKRYLWVVGLVQCEELINMLCSAKLGRRRTEVMIENQVSLDARICWIICWTLFQALSYSRSWRRWTTKLYLWKSSCLRVKPIMHSVTCPRPELPSPLPGPQPMPSTVHPNFRQLWTCNQASLKHALPRHSTVQCHGWTL